MKTKQYVHEFVGTAINKEKIQYVETFYVIAPSIEDATTIVTASNPKVTDLSYTGKRHACNEDWLI